MISYSWNNGYHFMCLWFSNNSRKPGHDHLLSAMPSSPTQWNVLSSELLIFVCNFSHVAFFLFWLWTSVQFQLLKLIFKFLGPKFLEPIGFTQQVSEKRMMNVAVWLFVVTLFSAFSNTCNNWCSVIMLEWKQFLLISTCKIRKMFICFCVQALFYVWRH